MVALIFLIVAGMLATTVSLATPRAATAQVEPLATASAVPETALFYAAVNLDRDSEQWSVAGDLIERAGLSEAVDQALSDANIGAAEQTVLDSLFGGEAALVLNTFPETGEVNATDAADTISDPGAIAQGATPEGFAIVLATDEPDAAYDTIAGQLEDAAEEAGAELETTEYEGVEIVSRPADDEFTTGQAIALAGNYVVIATIPADIEPIVDTVNGTTAPLAEEENFARLRGDLNQEFLALGFINGPAIIEGVEANSPEAFASVDEGTLASLQAYTGFVTWADTPGFRVDTLSIPAEGREEATAEPIEAALAERVSGDSLIYAAGSDLGATPGLEALGLVLAQSVVGDDTTGMAPEGEDPDAYAEQVFADAEEQLGFNIKSDFIDQLVGPFVFALTADDLFGGSPVIEGVLASGTENPETVSGVLDQVGELLEQTLEADGSTREVEGSTVHVLDLSSAGLPIVLELGVVNDELVVGLGNGLDSYVTGPEESLAESENFQAVMDELPQEYTTVGYVNLEAVISLVEEATGELSGQVADADPACGVFDTQEEAQAAYDEDSFENFALDQDFDGTACEDFFAPATPVPDEGASQFANIKSIATVSFVNEDLTGTSTLLYIADE